MEEYFSKYRKLLEEAEPRTNEEAFVGRLRRTWRVRTLRIGLSIVAVAAAVMLVALVPGGRNTMSAGECYMAAFNEGVEPLLDEVKAMEESSAYCSEKGYSTVIEELMGSAAEYASEAVTKGNPSLDPDTKEYCKRMAKKIKGLYADCVQAYENE